MWRNALKQADRSLAETVLPFDMKKLRPFQAGYFLGFRAERRDREKEEFTQEIEQEIKQYTRESLQNRVSGYDRMWISGTIGRPSRGKNGTMPCFRCG